MQTQATHMRCAHSSLITVPGIAVHGTPAPAETCVSPALLHAHMQLAFGSPYPPAGWPGPHPDTEVLLGVVASDIKLVARAYRDWCEALQLPLVAPTSRVSPGPAPRIVGTGERAACVRARVCGGEPRGSNDLHLL